MNLMDVSPDRGLLMEFYFYSIGEIEDAAEGLYNRANNNINRLSRQASEIAKEIKKSPGTASLGKRQEYDNIRKQVEWLQEDVDWAKDLMERTGKREDKETQVEATYGDMARLNLLPKKRPEANPVLRSPINEVLQDKEPAKPAKSTSKRGGKQ